MKQDQLELLPGYLDGTLSAEERGRLDAALAQDADLRAELDLQKKIDASLGRLFAAPDEQPEIERAQEPAQRPSVLWKFRWVGLAAAVLLAGAGAWYFNQPDPLLLSPQQVYANMQNVDFHPTWKCENDRQFIDAVKNRLGEGMLVHDENGVQVAGWAYGGTYSGYPISKDSMILITQDGNDHILVFVDRAAADRKLKVAKDSGLHLFRQTVGGLVLYEVTPRTEPVVLPLAKSAT